MQGSTPRKYRNVRDQFTAFRERAGVQDVIDPKLERLDACRGSRNLALTTTTKEIRTLGQFPGFCLKRNWSEKNVATDLETPANIKPSPVVPLHSAGNRAHPGGVR